MPATTNRSDVLRRSLPTIVLLGVLLASLGAAYLTVHVRRAPLREAADILEEIRSRGLSRYWGKSEVRFFQTDATARGPGGAIVNGWEMFVRQRGAEGGFQGIRIRFDPTIRHTTQPDPRIPLAVRRSVVLWEHWRLNWNATRGEYEAGYCLMDGSEFVTNKTVRWSDGHLRETSLPEEPTKKRSVEVATDDRFLPEGLEPLVRLLVAARGTTAQFQRSAAAEFHAVHALPYRAEPLVTLLYEHAGPPADKGLVGAQNVKASWAAMDEEGRGVVRETTLAAINDEGKLLQETRTWETRLPEGTLKRELRLDAADSPTAATLAKTYKRLLDAILQKRGFAPQ